MSGKIFINYRRGDDPGFTQALYQSLESDFPAADLFMDVEGHIKPGDVFADVLGLQVAACDVFLAVIGPRWMELLTGRSGDEKDFVVIEIKAALEQGKRVIPVLVGGASLPLPGSLPMEVRPLTERNAVALRPERFKADCKWLTSALRDSLAAAEQERAARTEAERKAAEIARQHEEARAAARAKEVEAVRSARSAEGLSAEEVRKSEELANWNFVRDRKKMQELRDHLARFPGGITENYAMTTLDALVWTSLGDKPAIPQLRAYIEQFPNGEKAAEAEARIAALSSQDPSTRKTSSREEKPLQKEKMPAPWPIQTAPIVLSVLAIVAGVFAYATDLGNLGKIDISDTIHILPFSFVLSSMILGIARLKYETSPHRDALLTAVSYYLGAGILQSVFVSMNQQMSAGGSNTAFLLFSAYFSSTLFTLLALGVMTLLPELVRRPSNLAMALVILPVVRAFTGPVVVATFGPLTKETVKSVFAAAIVLYAGILFAWIGYLMRSRRLRQADQVD